MLVVAITCLFSLSIVIAQEAPSTEESKGGNGTSIEGVWKGKVKGRKNRTFSAHIGIMKVGEVYKVRGTSTHKNSKITWYGEGTLNGNTLEYTYRVRNSNIRGKAILQLSADGKVLSGTFNEGSRKGSEKWQKTSDMKKEIKE